MLAKTLGAAVHGIRGRLVHVEVDLMAGLPSFSIVGLPDAAVRESRERVVAAVRNTGYDFPIRKIVVNLSPADVRKEGTAFDLPMAVGVLASAESIRGSRLNQYVMVGELALDGRVRPVKGLLSIALAVRAEGFQGLIFPAANWAEVSVVDGLDLVPVSTLQETGMFLMEEWSPVLPNRTQENILDVPSMGFGDVRGQVFAKRALEVAAAGGHNLIMIGPPGAGKTMLARCLGNILPPLEFEEALETTTIHSVAGMLTRGQSLMTARPVRSPHHTMSDVALVGGGAVPRPGEVSLAHNGVLFLDELPEFDRNALEGLRQPLEEGFVTVSRASGAVTFPARFMLVAAMNPCPCGQQGTPRRECLCTPHQVQRYRQKLSGPLLDRIDLHVDVPPLAVGELTDEEPADGPPVDVRARVIEVRERQRQRFNGTPVPCNARMGPRQIRQFCRLDEDAHGLLRDAIGRLGLSARSYHRILKVARTLADMSGADHIQRTHLAEAILYRALDRPLIPVGVG